MKESVRMAARALAAAGAGCLLAGLAGPAQRAEAVASAAAVQSLSISAVADRHWSYGQFDFSLGTFIPAHSRDGYGNAVVPYGELPNRWLALILHGYAAGHFVEVVWMWDNPT